MFRPSILALFFIFVTIGFTVAGQLLVKKGMLQLGTSPTQFALILRFVLNALSNPNVVLGLACAVVAALSWTVAISRSNLSFAYPFMALAIVLVLALSGSLFNEAVPTGRWVGVLIVCIGLTVAALAG